MLDNALITNLIKIMDDGLAAINVTGITVAQDFQPTQQGMVKGPALYLHQVGPAKRVGFMRSDSRIIDNVMTRTQTQALETHYQYSALSTQDPANQNQLTAQDIAQYAAYVMQSTDTVAKLSALGLGVLHVKEVRPQYFSDDRQRYEADATFDFGITHKQIIVTTVPVVETEEFQILPV